MTECKNCGEKVTATFARVYGDNDNNVYRCVHCVKAGDSGRQVLHCGGAAFKDEKEIERRIKIGIRG